jgi:hypothetical protein
MLSARMSLTPSCDGPRTGAAWTWLMAVNADMSMLSGSARCAALGKCSVIGEPLVLGTQTDDEVGREMALGHNVAADALRGD